MEALDSIVRMLELKHKNSLDHASRLEERENELKKVSQLFFLLDHTNDKFVPRCGRCGGLGGAQCTWTMTPTCHQLDYKSNMIKNLLLYHAVASPCSRLSATIEKISWKQNQLYFGRAGTYVSQILIYRLTLGCLSIIQSSWSFKKVCR